MRAELSGERVTLDPAKPFGQALSIQWAQPSLTLVQPVTGFHVASVHSMVL
jgi:hypothetical protein